MTATMNGTRARVTVENGWAVRDLPNGDQVRARLRVDEYPCEPERGAGMWNEGVLLVRERDGYGGIDLDAHEGLSRVLDRINETRDLRTRVYADEYSDRNHAGTAHCDRETFVRRYLRAFWDVQHAELRTVLGSGPSDWADIWVVVTRLPYGGDADALAEDTLDQWSAWARGDVYFTETETRTLHDAMEAESADDGWVSDETMGTYYGGDEARYGLAEALGVSEADVPDQWDVTVIP